MQRYVLLLMLLAGSARATPAEPTSPHPRMLLDGELRQAWHAHARLPVGPVIGAIRLCHEARTTTDHDRALYQGSEWAKVLQACLVAWAATDSEQHATTAIRFFTAMLDDLDHVGDHRGGDEAARRDHGYALRNLGPYTALAYDWLHDHPALTPELKARARQRWQAWLDWYRDKGYRATTPGSNYQAGYLLAATMIAIAEAGDTGGESRALWQRVVDQMWGKEMAAALAQGGVLAGGNWPEGWQYGPLSVAEYALGARLMQHAGVAVPGISTWLSSVLRHHIYALSPGDRMFAGGDTEFETANLAPQALTLDAIALGDASPDDKRWARGELSRLRIVDRDWLLYDALAAIGERPVLAPRSAWPTWYLAAGTGTLYARTRWDDGAIWFVSECHATIDTDHRHANAGNFVLARGRDDVIVDPTPYGSQSTLTGNAPTVASAQLPKDYTPSQGFWSQRTGYDFVTQRASGVVAARCDYSDQYRFQDRASDVPDAYRDLVLVPSVDGRDAALVVIDRADTGGDDRGMDLRFRTPGHLALDGETGWATLGGTKLVIANVSRTSGKAAIGVPSAKDCFHQAAPKGQCDAARFPVTDYRVHLAGPRPVAVHLISATDARHAPATAIPLATVGDGWAGVRVTGVRDAVIVWRTHQAAVGYAAPPGLHVVLDAGSITSARRDGDRCIVNVGAGAGAVVASLDANCQITLDPEAPAASALGTHPVRARTLRSPRAGCCGAQATPGSSIAMTVIVLFVLIGRPRRTER